MVNKLDRPEFGTKFKREVPLFLEIPESPYNTCRISGLWKKASMPKQLDLPSREMMSRLWKAYKATIHKIPRALYSTSCKCVYRVGQKKRGHRITTIFLSNLNRFTNFFTGRFFSKFAVKCILNIPPHVPCVATLPCETLMSAKQAINDKLQGSVATYLRCGGVVINQIKKNLLMSVCENFF